MASRAAFALFVALALFGFAFAEEEHDHDHDHDHDSHHGTHEAGVAQVIKGEVELELSDTELLEDNSFVVGVTRGLAKFLSIDKSQVKITVDHSGHDHRRLAAGKETVDYEINFPAGTAEKTMDGVLDTLKEAKANTAKAAEMLKSMKDELETVMPGASAKIKGVVLKTTPALSDVKEVDSAMGSACSGAVVVISALALASSL
eukprot:TRINITY_DN66677_c0_g1_i1.p1 TRINITY_DN66677_c0_g1~~TRINITY_DN66677_c0_g1_i1.p1  ORF type:complete len:220 (+),score=52.95 TRINITY_DN66677_c0_g1_i1:52-660(+)